MVSINPLKVLAEGKRKFTILTEAPANESAPTAAELNAGLDLSLAVLAANFAFGPTDSDTVSEPTLGDTGNTGSFARDNYNIDFTIFRAFLAAGGIDPTNDAGYEALRRKGATVWGYTRQTDVLATADWEEGEEYQFGSRFQVDHPMEPGDSGGNLKRRIRGQAQSGHVEGTVAA